MPVLTAAQLNQIGNKMLIIQQAIDSYLDSPAGRALPQAQQDSLAAQRDQIGLDVEDIASEAITVALNNAAKAVAQLNVVTEDIKGDVTHIADVQKIIDLAGAALTLTAAILATPVSAGAIAAAIPGVVTAVEAVTGGDSDT